MAAQPNISGVNTPFFGGDGLGAGNLAGRESSLSNWAGPYVTDMLGKAQATADLPYQAYQGPLTAGASPLQTQAFGGISGLAAPGAMEQATSALGDIASSAQGMTYDPNQFSTQMFNQPGVAESYMNPFIQQALEPELAEMRRQAEIQRINDAGRLTQAGAFGGSRQAIMESELSDNMARLMAERTGAGYRDAFDRAGQMFTSDQARALQAEGMGESSRQFGSTFGLDSLAQSRQAREAQGAMASRGLQSERDILADQLRAGTAQRGIESEGIGADYAQFQQERDYPQQQLQFLQSMLQGLPLEAQQAIYTQPSTLGQILGGSAGGIESIQRILNLFNSEDPDSKKNPVGNPDSQKNPVGN